MNEINETLAMIAERMASLEKRVEAIFVGQLDKEWYSTDEVASLTDRAPWTVREWCRLSRIKAKKRPGSDKWVVARDEVDRLMNEGLLSTSTQGSSSNNTPFARKPR